MFLYYDTPDFLLIRRSLDKPLYKEKLRMRSYGSAGAQTPVFVELKKKYRAVVYKRRIVLPQAFKNVLPAMCNEFVAVTKETSLASTFYVGDLMTQYQTISGKTYLVIEPLVIIGVIYFVVTFTMSKLIAVLERRLKTDD